MRQCAHRLVGLGQTRSKKPRVQPRRPADSKCGRSRTTFWQRQPDPALCRGFAGTDCLLNNDWCWHWLSAVVSGRPLAPPAALTSAPPRASRTHNIYPCKHGQVQLIEYIPFNKIKCAGMILQYKLHTAIAYKAWCVQTSANERVHNIAGQLRPINPLCRCRQSRLIHAAPPFLQPSLSSPLRPRLFRSVVSSTLGSFAARRARRQ